MKEKCDKCSRVMNEKYTNACKCEDGPVRQPIPPTWKRYGG